MKAVEIRTKFLEYFERKGHSIIPSASLIPENDPSVLFTTAGMQPLVPYLMGQPHPQGRRLVDSQKCLRTGDIDEVGDGTHHTFFEMLGNWSLGDYFKVEAIEWSFVFVTQELGLPVERLAISVFSGDNDAPQDKEAAEKWLELGIFESRIAYLGKNDNWWPAGGKNPGPQGPDTEIFYWSDNDNPAPKKFEPKDDRWVEIWNNVFMQFNKTEAGDYEPLKQLNVDTGMGLERITAIINGLADNYQTDLFWPIIEKIQEITGLDYRSDFETKRSMRIIADHLKAAVMIMGDRNGLAPSNLDQGYILRRLIRRAIRMGKKLGLNENFTTRIAEPVFAIYKNVYPEIIERHDFVIETLDQEEHKFRKTLETGLKEFDKMVFDHLISGEEAFILFSTYGFPLEMTQELAKEKDLKIDLKGFEREFKKHQDLSRSGAEEKFKGGLSDTSEQTVKYHTTTHLLHQALKNVLGDHVEQRGSNITEKRLRFDFTHGEKMTAEEIQQVEDIVNEQINKKLPVIYEEMTVDEAKAQGAIGLFEGKYGDQVKVYTVGDFSKEICGGPHVETIAGLGKFKIKKEQSSSAGIRRIKAVLE